MTLIRKAARILRGYKLNQRSFLFLERELPADLVYRLRPLEDKGFSTQAEFSATVETVLERQFSRKQLAIILYAGKRAQVRRVISSLQQMKRNTFPSSPFTPSLLSYTLLRPFFFSLWFRLRRLKGPKPISLEDQLTRRRLAKEPDAYVLKNVLPYNRAQASQFSTEHRYRTERVMLVLKALCGWTSPDKKLLVVGPRNEAEVLLLSLHGFPLKNITAIDLFSASSKIQVMDMHNLDFENDSFDIYYSGFTLAYSETPAQACAEAIRVTKDGGLIVLMNTLRGVSLLAGKDVGKTQGVADTLKLFQPNVRHVYFQEESEWQHGTEDPEHQFVTAIFSVQKPGG